jgi:hypothetical protein
VLNQLQHFEAHHSKISFRLIHRWRIPDLRSQLNAIWPPGLPWLTSRENSYLLVQCGSSAPRACFVHIGLSLMPKVFMHHTAVHERDRKLSVLPYNSQQDLTTQCIHLLITFCWINWLEAFICLNLYGKFKSSQLGHHGGAGNWVAVCGGTQQFKMIEINRSVIEGAVRKRSDYILSNIE